MRVAVGSLYLENTVANLQYGYVEGTASQVVHCDGLVGLLVQAISQGRRRGFVDDAQHLEAGNTSGIFGRVALAVVEVSGDRDHGLCDGLAQLGLGVLLQLLQHHCGYLRRSVRFVAHLDVCIVIVVLHNLVREQRQVLLHAVLGKTSAHEAFDGVDGVLGIGHSLALGRHAHVSLAGTGVYSHD